MKSISETFSEMSVTFRDESNDSSSVLISYSDATVTALNYSLIVRSKTSLVRVKQYHSCESNFVIRLYLIPLINGQNIKKFSSKLFHKLTKHGHGLLLGLTS